MNDPQPLILIHDLEALREYCSNTANHSRELVEDEEDMPEVLLDLQYSSGANELSAQVFKLGKDSLVLNISSRDQDSIHARKLTEAEWQNVEDQIREGWCPHGLAHDFQSIFPLMRYAVTGSVIATQEDMEIAKYELVQGRHSFDFDMNEFFGVEQSFVAADHRQTIKDFIEAVINELAEDGEYDHLREDEYFRFEVEFDDDLKPEFSMGVTSGWMIEDIRVSDFMTNKDAVVKAIEDFLDVVIDFELENRRSKRFA
ncbi:hypothetical protein ACS3QZ_19620 (plasmid) [Shimia sp. W99]